MLCREAAVWHQLDHPHVLSFLGVDQTTWHSCHAMVSPWLTNGNLLDFIENSRCSHKDIIRLLSETAQGLLYLHLQGIVHGDLRAVRRYGGIGRLRAEMFHCRPMSSSMIGVKPVYQISVCRLYPASPLLLPLLDKPMCGGFQKSCWTVRRCTPTGRLTCSLSAASAWR
jgi:serine/threonine protein kinase